MAWYQRTYFNFKKILINILNFKNIIFCLSIYLFLFYCNNNITYCTPAKSVLKAVECNNIKFNVFGSLSNLDLFNYTEKLHQTYPKQNIFNLNSKFYNNVSVKKFKDENGNYFPFKHPMNHYHLSFKSYNVVNPKINISFCLSTKKVDYSFNELSDISIFRDDKMQYIGYNIIIYNVEDLQIYEIQCNEVTDFLKNNKININKFGLKISQLMFVN